MPIIATKKEFTKDLIEEGSYIATIYSVIEMGTQLNPAFGTESKKIRLTFELPTELKVFKEENGEQPRVISQEYSLSLSEKASLRKIVEACVPSALKLDDEGMMPDFDVENLIGKNCLITIKHKETTKGAKFQNVENVTIVPKGMQSYKQINETKVLSFDNWNDELFNSLPEFIKDKIMVSSEYKVLKGLDLPNADDIGF